MKTAILPINILPLLICITTLYTAGCSTQIRVTEYPTNKESRLVGFSTYCWSDENNQESALEKIEPTGGHHYAFDKDVRNAINTDLAQKGYAQTNCTTAHFIIDYRIGLHEDVAAVDATFADPSVNAYGPRWSIGDDRSVNYEGLAEPKEEIITVRHGTVHIAAFSSANKILWHSSAEKTLNEQDSDETRKTNIKAVVRKIMAGFPAKLK